MRPVECSRPWLAVVLALVLASPVRAGDEGQSAAGAPDPGLIEFLGEWGGDEGQAWLDRQLGTHAEPGVETGHRDAEAERTTTGGTDETR